MTPLRFSISSSKHSIPESDQRHAIANALLVQLIERDVVLVIGPPHPQTERLVKILIRALPSGDKRVFHATELGPKFRPFLEKVQK